MKKRLLILLPIFLVSLCGCKNKTSRISKIRNLDEYDVYLKYHPEYKESKSEWEKNKQALFNEDEIAKSKIKNIIYIIGDGMGFGSVKAGELYSNKKFEFANWATFASNTNSLNKKNKAKETTDSAAGGTALATGTLTSNGVVGRDKDQNDLETVLDVAKAKGKSIGVITTDSISGATPAAFSAHAKNRGDTADILLSQANSNVDLLIGAYTSFYNDNISKFEEKGFVCATSLDESIQSESRVFINNKDMTPFDGNNTLKDSTKYAVDYLSKNDNGFALMIEQAHIDKYAHNHDFDNLAKSSIELNNTLCYLIDNFKDRDDTLIVITADHDNGGLRVSENTNLRNKVTVDGRTFSYRFKYQGHSQEYVPVYMNKPVLSFNFLGISDGRYVLKNTEIAKSIKSLITR